MNDGIFEHKRTVSYFIWDYTRHENALASWYCAEDMAYCMERLGVAGHEDFAAVLRLRRDNPAYIDFIRNIAFRIFIYTGCDDETKNWFIAERLTLNGEWLGALLELIHDFREIRMGGGDPTLEIQSDMIRNFYNPAKA